ncbi:transcriptional regulator [Mesorhizobium sp. L-8-10]|uniref:LysR family transcriptional regulator n=1 Tax=Mesorhizobium sp. L-8-10 TaxID=2744523 RepID=UPI00192571C5|nr:LysR family transcriptional regulator [Mesorhizobium sp. L-8-10]BCH29356.1 transcriptional regulator [Mesorhizobium sp. L-8-10]
MINDNFLRQRLKIRHLRLIRSIHERKSISLAAEEMGVTQAAVSKTKAEIEDFIGMPLFRHDQERWQPTEIGSRLIHGAYLILSEIDAINDELMHLREGVQGTVAVGLRTYALLPSLAKATTMFKELFPQVTLSLVDAPYGELIEQAERGQIDMVISPLAEEVPRFRYSSIPIKGARHMIFGSVGHPLGIKDNPTWKEAIEYPWCLSPTGTRTRRHFEVLIEKLRLPFPSNVIETNSLVLSMNLLREGKLLTVIPVGVAQGLGATPDDELGQFKLLVRDNVGGPINLPLYDMGDTVTLTWASDRVPTPAARLLRDFLILRFNPDERRSVPDFKWTGPAVEPEAGRD